MDTVELLRDIEYIHQVKYRYLRCIDVKLWEELGDTLTEDAVLHTGTSAFGKLVEITGRHEIAAFLTAKLGPAVLTGHTASQPEITVDGDTATGIWSYRETVLSTRHRMVIAGTGFSRLWVASAPAAATGMPTAMATIRRVIALLPGEHI